VKQSKTRLLLLDEPYELSEAEHALNRALKLSGWTCPGPEMSASPRPTPQTTINALMYSMRSRGLQALREPDTMERLSRCDEGAIRQIAERLATLGWPPERIKPVIACWQSARKDFNEAVA
jgi:hypothetical protein